MLSRIWPWAAIPPAIGGVAWQKRKSPKFRNSRALIHQHHCACQEQPGPKNVDVLVVGGGIAGISTAWFLARQNCRVAVAERQSCGSGATGLSAATLEVLGKGDQTDWHAQLTSTTVDALQELKGQGHDIGFVQSGSIELIPSEAEVAYAMAKFKKYQDHGYDVAQLSVAEAKQLEPALEKTPFVGALYMRQSGYADPGATMEALVEEAKASGAFIFEDCMVTSANHAGAEGWVVDTSTGRFTAKHVVVCSGAWAAEVGRLFGVELPVVKVKAQMSVADSDAPDRELTHVIYNSQSKALWAKEEANMVNQVTHDYSGRRRVYHTYGRPGPVKGSVWMGGDRLPLLDDDFNVDEIAAGECIKNWRDKIAPALQLRSGDAQSWAGVVGPSAGGPIIGEVNFRPGLWICTGFGGAGFMYGVAAGAAVASWISASQPSGNGSMDAFSAVRLGNDPTPWVRPVSVKAA